MNYSHKMFFRVQKDGVIYFIANQEDIVKFMFREKICFDIIKQI